MMKKAYFNLKHYGVKVLEGENLQDFISNFKKSVQPSGNICLIHFLIQIKLKNISLILEKYKYQTMINCGLNHLMKSLKILKIIHIKLILVKVVKV